MESITQKDLLKAGVHFGHLKKKWNPKMAPYIFMERKGIHLIDLNKTADELQNAAAALRSIARSGKKILFVATKKQAKEIVEEAALRSGMPHVTERWLGGMLTNFATIRRSIKKMQTINSMFEDGTAENITKKERLTLYREKTKIEKVLGGIENLTRIPAALFIVDISHENIAMLEAKKLNITTFAMVDTNSDPNDVDFPIPANDDASKSIRIITEYLTNAILEGLDERKKDKAEMEKEEKKGKEEKEVTAKTEASEEKKEDKPKRKRRKKKASAEKKTEKASETPEAGEKVKATKSNKEAKEKREKDEEPQKETIKTKSKDEVKAKKETSSKGKKKK